MRKNTFLVCLLLLACAARSEVRKYSNDYLHIGMGARALSLSGAMTAATDDVYSLYYNPAGLAQINKEVQLSLMHSEYFGGIAKYDCGALAFDLKPGKNALALGMVRYAVDDIPNTLDLYNSDGSINYDNITSFSVGDYGFFLSYAHKLRLRDSSELCIGGGPKLVYRRAGGFASAIGFGLDLGAQYRRKAWRFGLMLRDASSTFNAWSFHFTEEEKLLLAQTANSIPLNSLEVTAPQISLSAAYQWKIKNRLWIMPCMDLVISTDGKRNVLIPGDPISIDLNSGFEIGYKDIVQLRAGIGNIQRSTDDDNNKITSFQPAIGIGVGFKYLHLDYAFTDVGNQSEGLYAHIISLKVSLPKKGAGEQ